MFPGSLMSLFLGMFLQKVLLVLSDQFLTLTGLVISYHFFALLAIVMYSLLGSL